jgi:hypothetical protein
LLQKGITPVIVEKDDHPRFHVGETLTGATGLALKELRLGPRLDAENYSIKNGVTLYGPDGKMNSGFRWSGATRTTFRFPTSPGT